MKVISSPQILKRSLNKASKSASIGFVPTMGALHEGHLSLIRKAARENDCVVVSIFVNPAQFGPKEDLSRYPRTLKEDLKHLRELKVDYVFTPTAQAMYPEGFDTVITVGLQSGLLRRFCGKSRKGHFEGVATVVHKLFQIVNPTHAYFGQKDYQQAVILKKMVRDLQMNVTMCVCPIVREKSGLAMSSRNRYLSDRQREQATELSAVLKDVARQAKGSSKSLSAIQKYALKRLSRAFDRVEYLEFAEADTLKPISRRSPKMAVLAAVFMGKTRLIDNVIIQLRNWKPL